MSTQQPSTSEHDTIRAACDARLRTVFGGGGLAWIIDEQYVSDGPVWRVKLVYEGAGGRWMRRQYRYDIPSDTLHFAGEEPIPASAALVGRRTGRRL